VVLEVTRINEELSMKIYDWVLMGIGILFLVGIKPLLIILILITAFMYAF
tara:strand:+ start:298 stop:447 length:150 start_codon:yes stop_codon:yes gene_type:complete